MDDLGTPSSYLALELGTPVFAADGTRIGTVVEILDAPDADIFDGLMLDTDSGRRFAEASLVDEIFERGVVLKPDAGAASALPERG
ncbi:MAG: hypothetical protein ABI726_02995 [bacterium]